MKKNIIINNKPDLKNRAYEKDEYQFWLSVLIPSYEYAEGVDRILEAIAMQKPFGVECIIRDDSISDDVRDLVGKYLKSNEFNHLIYVKNADLKGAVENWNSLLSMARGKFVILMHHDEFPIGKEFFTELREELFAFNDNNILVMGCLIAKESDAYLRRHMPALIQSFLLKIMGPTYLLRHNFIGPPSVIVARRSTFQYFDSRFKWLVDVEWMNRSLQLNFMRYRISRNLCVASLTRREASITASLKSNLSEIERMELARICAEQEVGLWSLLLQPRNVSGRLLKFIDSCAWMALKILAHLLAFMVRVRNPFYQEMRRL